MNEHPDIEEIMEFLSDMDAGKLEIRGRRFDWEEAAMSDVLKDSTFRFRFVPNKPKTVFTKRVGIPAPYRGEMELEQKYYVPNIYYPAGPNEWAWYERTPHINHREDGIVYLNPEDAAAAGRAMVERDDD